MSNEKMNIFDGIDEEIENARKEGKPSLRERLKVEKIPNIFDGVDEEIEKARKKEKPSKEKER